MVRRRRRNTKPIKIGWHEVINIAPAGPPNGAQLTMKLYCGECDFYFERIYHMAQLAQGFPHETCENCGAVNYVPYTISGRNA